jgi:hypothetical protein
MAELDVLKEIVGLSRRQDNSVSVCLASETPDGQNFSLAALNFTTNLRDAFWKIVSDHLAQIEKLISQGDLEVRGFEAGYKPDDHEVEWMDVTGIQSVMGRIDCVPANVIGLPIFDGDDDFVGRLRFYVIIVTPAAGKRVLFFRKYNAQRELSRSKMFAALLSGEQYDRIVQPTFLFDQDIDCFCRDNTMFIRRRHDFQTVFGYFEHIQRKASQCLSQIRQVLPITNFQEFEQSCGSHVQKMMKLANIAASPYLQQVKMKDIRKVIKKFDLVGVKIVRHNGIEAIEFDPTNRWVILKLLNDDYLGSVMTKSKYEVNSKRKL